MGNGHVIVPQAAGQAVLTSSLCDARMGAAPSSSRLRAASASFFFCSACFMPLMVLPPVEAEAGSETVLAPPPAAEPATVGAEPRLCSDSGVSGRCGCRGSESCRRHRAGWCQVCTADRLALYLERQAGD